MTVALVAALLVAACSSSGSSGKASSTSTPSSGGAAAGAVAALRPLHALRGTDPRVVDDRGDEVLLRGVNVNSYGDYFEANPAYPATIPLTDADWAAMQADGFDVVRLIMSWSLLEPVKGRVDPAYLAELHRVVADAARHGIYTVLDLHQDAWSKYVASPPGVVCPSGAKPGIGWDGAPAWATLTDGADTCAPAGIREVAQAPMHAFEHFYANDDGLEDQMIATWSAVARSFARDTNVAGYDLLNEPNWGLDSATGGARLGALYRRLIPAIRQAEKVGGGFSHVAFFEPVVIFPNPGTLPPASDVTDPNVVFAPHNYHGSSDAGTPEEGFANTARAAAGYRTTSWIGEYGWFGEGAADEPMVARFAKAQDEAMVGGAWWQWQQACGDPHTLGARGATPPAQVIELNVTGCPGDRPLGPVKEWLPIVTRSYPRTAPGHLTSLRADGPAGTISLSGDGHDASADARLVVWVPNRGHGLPKIGGQGISDVTHREVRGGWLVTARACAGGYALTIGPDAPALTGSCATSQATDDT